MANLPEEYDRVALEEELRDLQQKIDDMKTFQFFIPLLIAPVDPKVGTVAYNAGSGSTGFGSTSEGFYRYASNGAWHKIG
jgi:hypothetical protein